MKLAKCGLLEASGPDYLSFTTEDLFLSHVKDADSQNYTKLPLRILVRFIIIWHGNIFYRFRK
jgi:hypothetical protein